MTGFLDKLAVWLNGPASPAPAPPRAEPPAPAVTADDPRLRETSRPLVARLLASIANIGARAQGDALMASALTEVRQMRDSHLPRLIESYADIPHAHRAEIFRQTGRSASYTSIRGSSG